MGYTAWRRNGEIAARLTADTPWRWRRRGYLSTRVVVEGEVDGRPVALRADGSIGGSWRVLFVPLSRFPGELSIRSGKVSGATVQNVPAPRNMSDEELERALTFEAGAGSLAPRALTPTARRWIVDHAGGYFHHWTAPAGPRTEPFPDDPRPDALLDRPVLALYGLRFDATPQHHVDAFRMLLDVARAIEPPP